MQTMKTDHNAQADLSRRLIHVSEFSHIVAAFVFF